VAGWLDDLVPGTAQQAMYVVGVIEIVAGVAVAVALARLAVRYAPARRGGRA